MAVSYLDRIAETIRVGLLEDALPNGDTQLLFRIYALLALAKGQDTNGADVHHGWVVWMLSRGEEHPAMIPYSALPASKRAEDEPFAEAIRRTAATLTPDV